MHVSKDPIAIVGIGCRFPGRANDPASFWELLCDGVDAVTEVPADRWNNSTYYDAEPGKPGKTNSRSGGFIEGVDLFDCGFFRISPREAAFIDPQQRLLLEVAWEAIEDGGQVIDLTGGSDIGVFVGISEREYGEMQSSYDDRSTLASHSATGGAMSLAANRISYCLNLHGPSLAVDTACSSALVAVHLACRSLWNGDCGLVLAGGVNLLLKPEMSIAFSQASMLSPDGRCKAFDAAGNGFVRSEGAGMILLKPLAAALADGDRIYACIRGTAVNQDGQTNGITVPSQSAQEALVRAACQDAGVHPREVQYVEAHGTGTAVGDPLEANALGAALATGRDAEAPCLIGSVKTNIGHLEPAAGMPGIIKAALAVKHGLVPPNLHFRQPNPHIDFVALKLRVPTAVESLDQGSRPVIAGVNSFGFGGTNAHVVVESPPRCSPSSSASALSPASAATHLLPLSASSPEALAALASAYKKWLSPQSAGATFALGDICHAASRRRTHHQQRVALVAHSHEELIAGLDAFLAGESYPEVCRGQAGSASVPKLAFVFSGQGLAWWAMGRELLRLEPAFRDHIKQCDELFRALGAGDGRDGGPVWREFCVDESVSGLHEGTVSQWAIFSFQVALAALWRTWGIEPDAVVGHSLGEVAAAHVAGALTLEQAAFVVFHRARCMQQFVRTGKMLAVGLPLDEAEALIGDQAGRVVIGAVNSPSSVTLSGDAEALHAIFQGLERRQVFCRFLRVDFPFHSPYFEPARDEFLGCVADLQPQPETIPIVSTVTGQAARGIDFDAAHWWRNFRDRVQFAAAVDELAAAGHTIFLEISPHPALASAIHECLRHREESGTVLASLRRKKDERATMLGALGVLHCAGRGVNWEALYPGPGGHLPLPSYPWQREPFWHECQESRAARLRTPDHPLLGRPANSAVPCWENRLDQRLLPYLKDHRIQGRVVVPAAAYVEMALSVARQTFGDVPCAIENAEFQRAFALPDEPESPRVQFVHVPKESSFSIHSRLGDSAQPWRLHALGKLRPLEANTTADPTNMEELRQCLDQEIERGRFYQALQNSGADFGISFQGVRRVWRRQNEILGEAALPAHLTSEADSYRIHPALLDCFIHLLAALCQPSEEPVANVYLPVRIARLHFYENPGPSAWCHAWVTKVGATHIEGNIRVMNEAGRTMIEMLGFRFQAVGADSAAGVAAMDWLYELHWRPKPLPSLEPTDRTETPASAPSSWLLFTDGCQVARELAELIAARGDTCVLVSPGPTYQRLDHNLFQVSPGRREDVEQLLEEICQPSAPACRGAIHLWGLDPRRTEVTADGNPQSADADLQAAEVRGCHSVLALTQAVAGLSKDIQIWIVTRGAQAVGGENGLKNGYPNLNSVEQSPLWGLGRVILNEQPALSCRMIDLSPAGGADEARWLLAELSANDGEEEIAWRDPTRYVARLVRVSLEALPKAKHRPLDRKDQVFRLELPKSHVLDDVAWHRLPTRTTAPPGPGEVEIEVCAAGLNFRDVMLALGIYPSEADSATLLGLECAGRIVAVGEGVENFRPGDEVIAMGRRCLASHVTTIAEIVAPKPAHLTWEEATTIPIAFMTSWYGLHHLAQLAPGERVLIHAATGGVGLAALQIARQAGAEIFATAGSPEKRDYLRSLGVVHVMDSRTLTFADEVLEITDGRGVDVVLNSLAGEAIAKGISALGRLGRFVEIGKRDIFEDSRLGLRPFAKNLSFFTFDLPTVVEARPHFMGSMLRDIARQIEAGTLRPLPLRTFGASEVAGAFRHLAQAKHIGKVVVSLDEPEVVIEPTSGDGRIQFADDATYLISGGLGGFGIAVAQWLVEHGARRLVLVGRSGVSSEEARAALDAMAGQGAQVVVAQADVADEDSLGNVLAQVQRTMPPLRGIIHAAMQLDDGVLLRLDGRRFRKVTAPKVDGAWNLHKLTLDQPLDFFVMFSSISSLLGNSGQGNYAAANAFLDALAHHRQALGLPALTVNWGAVADVGYLAKQGNVAERLARQGVAGLTARQAMEVLEKLLQKNVPQICVARIDWRQLADWSPSVKACPRYAELFAEALDPSPGPGHHAIREALAKAAPSQRQRLLDEHLRQRVAHVLRISPSRLPADKAFNELGLDSLMGVELINRIESDLRVSVPGGTLLAGQNLSRLTAALLEIIDGAAPAPHAAVPPTPASVPLLATTNATDAGWVARPEPYATGVDIIGGAH